MSKFAGYPDNYRIRDLKKLYIKILKYKYRVFRLTYIGNGVYEIEIESNYPDTPWPCQECIGIFVSLVKKESYE